MALGFDAADYFNDRFLFISMLESILSILIISSTEGFYCMDRLIKSSVGFRGTNNEHDLRIVRKLLSENGFRTMASDSNTHKDVVRALTAFQKTNFIYVTGIVMPNCTTFKTLKQKINIINRSGYDSVHPRYSACNMRPSQDCLNLMRQYEKYQQYPYDDQTAKRINRYCKGATVGYGHLIVNAQQFEKYRNGMSMSEATKLFNKNLEEFVLAVQQCVKTRVSQNEFDALVMLTYNIGSGNDRKRSGLFYSNVLKIVNGESVDDLYSAWKLYTISQGNVMNGLIHRRRSEYEVFVGKGYTKI
ncbi:MAG TPA: lysozyme [Scandinavium sp.]|jgi:GH24 family phage-related lysozyme (muramidase)|uniref:lysozyme n=1 Tax=Scandinavium sp. TaxID=2830653 RepID=UPI002E3544F2|nr:lysozyme [Scandinavium sp.]HEX4502545.1 lysozyme [Scandinavium sp.]